jgi:hypothetical protein
MLIRTCGKRTGAPPPRTPGLLIGVENPSPALAGATVSILGLAAPPHSLLLAIPPRTIVSTPLEKAMAGAAADAAKWLSKELASSPGAPPVVRHGIDLFWLGVKVAKLFDRWNDDKKDIPALVIDSASAIASGLLLGQKAAGFDGGLFGGDFTSERLGMIFTAAGAAAKGQDISMALLNRTAASTPLGNGLEHAGKIVAAALSPDPAWRGVKFGPLPGLELADRA